MARRLLLFAILLTGCSTTTVTPPGSSSASASASTGSSGTSTTSSTSGSSSGTSSASSTSTSGTSGANTLASHYPGDVGIDSDPAVIWHENFEEGTVAAVVARYDDHSNDPGMQLVADVPPRSSGSASIKWTAGGSGANATDVFKQLPDHDEIWARWYVKYQAGIPWHHTGVWIGGYNPSETYPNPQAGLLPTGDDRFSVSIEPVFNVGAEPLRLDFYNYWMQMHSWMATPDPSTGTAYYGNSLVHQNAFTADEGQWMCIEVHIKLNTDPSSATGGVLEVWKNDALVRSFGEQGALGDWLRDKFCPQSADGSECTDYPPDPDTTMIPLNLQYRSTSNLHINAFWPQNYITDTTTAGSVQYDDMVVATERIGCLQ